MNQGRRHRAINITVALVLAFSFSLMTATPAQAAAISAGATGLWSATTTWTGGVVPTSGDTVTIAGGYTVTVDIANAACSTLTLGASGKLGGLTFNSGSQLTVGAGTGTVTFEGNKVNTLTMTSGGTLIAGSLVLTNTSLTWTPGTGTVQLQATNTLPASVFTSFYNLTITTGTTTLAVNLAINSGGTLTINSGATLARSTYLLTLNGNLINNGGTTSGSGGVTIAGTATQSIGSFTTTGTVSMTKTAGTATFTGNVNGGAFTLSGSGGTLNLGAGLTHTFTGAWTRTNGALLGNSSTLNIGGTTTNTAGTFTAGTSTVKYNGAAQTIANVTYNNLTLSGSGAKTTTGATVNGILSMEGTATASAAPTYGASAVLEYAGSSTQTTGPELTATIPNLSINNANGIILNSSPTISNTLTLTSGNITTGTNTVIIGSSGSVSGGSSSSFVLGNLQKYVATGATSRTFEVGTASGYTPVTVAFGSVSVAGNLSVNATAGEHANIAPSRINSSKDVNAYWTLTNSGITFDSYSATFTFVSGDVDGGANTSIFIVGRYSGGWTYPTVGTRTSTSTQATGVISLSDFAVGETYIWVSYSDPLYQNECNNFVDTTDHVYMKGENFPSGTTKVGYYDASGNWTETDTYIGFGGGNLTSECILNQDWGPTPPVGDGTWHSVVLQTSDNVPATYSMAIAHPNYIIDDDFYVAQSAIPEFPTVIAAIVVAGLCFGIYYWMRKRRLASVRS